MIRFGGPIFGFNDMTHFDPPALARAYKSKGYTAAYAPKVKLNETEKIKDIRKAFETEDIIIAEVGYWNNLMDTDPETKRNNRAEMLEAFRLAEELGAKCAVGLAGSYCHGSVPSSHSERNFSQEAFDEAVDMARYFIDSVKPKNAYFTYEIFQFGIVDSVEMIEKLLKAVDRRQFGVHLDLANLINSPRVYWKSGDIVRECIKRFGGRIVAAHAKDVIMKEPSITVVLEEVLIGQGMLDIAACIRELHKLPQDVPYMMEHLKTEEDYDRAAAHIRKVAFQEGIII